MKKKGNIIMKPLLHQTYKLIDRKGKIMRLRSQEMRKNAPEPDGNRRICQSLRL